MNWKPIVRDRNEAILSEPYAHLKLSHACPGPNGKSVPFQKYYTTTPPSHPAPQLGSYELLNLSKIMKNLNLKIFATFSLAPTPILIILEV